MLSYNPEELEDNTPKPGKYEARVVDAKEVKFNSGNKGLKVRLEVYTSSGRTSTCFEDCSYSPNGLKFLKRFLEAVGEDFNNPPKAADLVDKGLLAEFKVDGNFLAVDYYYEQPAKFKSAGSRAQVAEEDVPF